MLSATRQTGLRSFQRGASASPTIRTARLHSRARAGPKNNSNGPASGARLLIGASATFTAATLLSYQLSSSPIYNDAPVESFVPGLNPERTQQQMMRDRASEQGLYVWGSNRYNVVAPDSPSTTLVKTPRSIPYFAGMALRDIALEEKHAVAVDAYGDLIQWGLGFFDESSREVREDIEEAPLGRRREKERANELFPKGSDAVKPRDPVKTLIGKNIVKVVANDEKVFALSGSGDLYVISATQARQSPLRAADWSLNPFTLFGAFGSKTVDYEKIKVAPSATLRRGDRVDEIQAGSGHLLALTKKGRILALPIDDNGNSFGQLGFRRVLLNSPATPDSKASTVETIMEPRLIAQLKSAEEPTNATVMPSSSLPPLAVDSNVSSKPQPQVAGTADDPAPSPSPLTPDPKSIRFCTTLSEIPALREVSFAEIAAGNEHSLARTADGRVLAWGRCTHGQLGLGSRLSLECVPVPTEVVLAKKFPASSRDVKCVGVAAGGDNTFFVTERTEDGRGGNGKTVDVLSAGKGQWGTLGNAQWSQVKGEPARVKTVSGLVEFSERTNLTHPVPIHTISVGRPGHVALVLDTVEREGHAAFGRDVMVFGHNAAYQLGTGKRSNLAVPQHLPPLPPPTLSSSSGGLQGVPEAVIESKLAEADVNSGALTHMPHKRLQLVSETKSHTHGAPTDPSKEGKGRQKRGVPVEETISAGVVSMAIWWKTTP